MHQFTKRGVDAQIYGGYENAERMMLGFAPPYPLPYNSESSRGYDNEYRHGHTSGNINKDEPEALPLETFPIQTLAITYNGQFSKQLTHRDFLGAVLGLGLDRGKIGDIRLGDSGAIMYVADEVASFITENLQEVGRTSVTAEVIAAQSTEDLLGPETSGTSKRITVASLRLDAVISTAFHISRGKAATFIEAEKVFVNWAIGKKTQLLFAGDIVTIRGTGRVKIEEIYGQTKKDRVAIMITVF